MALYTRAEFARFIGKKNNYVGSYIQRGALVLSGDFIDDSIEPNKSWIKAYKEKNNLIIGSGGTLVVAGSEMQIAIEEPAPTKTTVRPQREEKPPPNVAAPALPPLDPGRQMTMFELEREKLEKDISKKDEEIRLLRLRAEKIEGSLIPTDLVKSLISQFSKSLSQAYSNAATNMMNEIETKTNLSSKDAAYFRGKINQQTNDAVKEGVENAIAGLENLIAEYSEQRGVGEKK